DRYPNVRAPGLYVRNTDRALIEGNVFDHNGWNDHVRGGAANVFSHNAYIQDNNSDIYVQDNIFANAASHALQMRSGGYVRNNVFINNPIGVLFGNGRDAKAGGVQGDISGNVFVGSASINGAPRGWAI